jgi:HEPN domain-containing protein
VHVEKSFIFRLPAWGASWVNAASDDLAAARFLSVNPQLSNLSAFHVQQCLEKIFKAVLEEYDKPVIKSHDLVRLKNLIKCFIAIPDDEMLKLINEIYIDSRYPGEMGLLPNGKPSTREVNEMIVYAESVFNRISGFLSGNVIETL